MEALDSHLLVFSPYLSLTALLDSDPGLSDLGQNAWAALNDAYRTDAPLMVPPHVLVLGCLYLASVICSRDISAWLEGVAVDANQVRACARRRAMAGVVRRGGAAAHACLPRVCAACRRMQGSASGAHACACRKPQKCVHARTPCVQVYAVAMELVAMYEHYRVPISSDEAARLLAVVQPPALPAAAAGAAAGGGAAGP